MPARANGEAIGLDVGGTKINAFRVARDGDDRRALEHADARRRRGGDAVDHGRARHVAHDPRRDRGRGGGRGDDRREGGGPALRPQPRVAEPPHRRADARARSACPARWTTTRAWPRTGSSGSARVAGTVTCCSSRSAPGSAVGSSPTAGCSAARTGSPPRSGTSSSSPDGPLCGCGNRGCWEQVAAGRAIDRMGREEAREREHSILAAPGRRRPRPGDRRAGDRGGAAGRRRGQGILAEVGRRLGRGSPAS